MKKLFFVLLPLLMIVAACKKSDDSTQPASEYPATPAAPVPANNAINSPLDGVLTWQACSDAQGDPVTYTVMVDNDNDLLTPFFMVQNLTASSCTVPGLTRGSTYYWKVIASDNHTNISTGPVWKFTTFDLNFGSFTDSRDGKVYRTIKIGDLTWMADNLAYVPAQGIYFYPNSDTALAAEYGILYYKDEPYLTSIAPAGWHIATRADFETLSMDDGGHMKMPGTEYWNSPNTGADNATGFSAKGVFDKATASFAAVFEFYPGEISYYSFVLFCASSDLINSYDYPNYQSNLFSIRCVKN
jgi:uncharacterized protein (TIGR02145 family)